MKKYFPILLLSLIAFSCKKESDSSSAPRPWLPSGSYMNAVKNYLKVNIADSDYVKVDFDNAIISKQPSGWFLAHCVFAQINCA